MRPSLASIRGNSAGVAPINLLSPEILAHIFVILVPHCMSESTAFEFYDIAAVCAYWRQVALTTKQLWTRIDIGPNTPDGFTNLLLKRTGESPIHVHVYDLPGKYKLALLLERTAKTVNMLIPHIHRVCALHLEAHNDGSGLIAGVLNLWLDCGSPSLSRFLQLDNFSTYWPLASDGQNSDEAKVSQSENAGRMLCPLSVLRLCNAYLSWNSDGFHNLVDLQLYFNPTDISTWQFAEILSANPALVKLALGDLEIIPDDRGQPTPVPMRCLCVLDLRHLHPASQELVFSLIDLSSSPSEIIASVSVSEQSQPELEAFLGRSRIRTLCCWGARVSLLSVWPCLLRPRGHASTLILYHFIVYDINATGPSPLPRLSHSSSLPPNVVLECCHVSFEGLKCLVAEHGIRQLEVEKCDVRAGNHSGLDDISNSLIKMFPGLECRIAEAIDSDIRYVGLFDPQI